MSRRQDQLVALARIARLKADQELARFAAVRAQAVALDQRVAGLEAELIEVAEGTAALHHEAEPPPEARPDAVPGTAAGGDEMLPGGGRMRGGAAGSLVDPSADVTRLRLAHALTRQVAIEREAARGERADHAPRFAAARAEASRAFGRAEVLAALHLRLAAEAKAGRD